MKVKLGELEQKVMGVVWDLGAASVKQVYLELSKSRSLAYTTVMTLMDRLEKNKFLKREKVGRAYVYKPVLNRKQTIKLLAKRAIETLTESFGTDAVAAFAEEIEEKNE